MQPRYTCAYLNGASVKSWHSEKCTNKLGYICYSQVSWNRPTEGNHTYSSIPTHFTFATLFSLMASFTPLYFSPPFFHLFSSRDGTLLRALGPLQWPLLLSRPHSKIVDWRSESLPSRRRRPSQHSQCGRAKLRHLSAWLWYISPINK